MGSKSSYNHVMSEWRQSKFNLDSMVSLQVDLKTKELGRISYVSANCFEILELNQKQLLGRDLECLMSEDFQALHKKLFEDFVRDPHSKYLGIA